MAKKEEKQEPSHDTEGALSVLESAEIVAKLIANTLSDNPDLLPLYLETKK